MPTRILVIDDEAGLRHTLSLILADEGYEVAVASDGEAGLRSLQQKPADIVLCDVRMPRVDGVGFLGRVREEVGDEVLVIMMSAYGTMDAAVEAMQKGAYDFVMKPFNADEILFTLRKAEERESLRREVRRLRRAQGEYPGFEAVIGHSAPMREAVDLAARVAPFPSTVLITGESGTGKEAFARAIHRASPRAEAPFVAVNCGAIPENLLESELFGYEKGAFTGADRAREGLFAEADGGTILLDEIGELPQSLQVKLLRVLQERTVRPLGGRAEMEVDVRVIAATSRDLAADAETGDFREDLYYRVNVVNIHLPPLRARAEDIPDLVDHFVTRHAPRLGIPEAQVNGDVLPVLTRYGWPGNVRELENVVERALVLSGGSIGPADLPPRVRDNDMPRRATAGDDLSVKRRLPALERELIVDALARTGGNKTRAAELLDLSVRALSYKMKDYELE
jgi:two-component system, NtrC family, response regulator AtoC